MGTVEIPAKFQHRCEGCPKTEVSDSRSRRPHWIELIVARDAYDFQGCAVADGTIKRLLCPECAERVSAAVNAALSTSNRVEPK